MHFLRARRALVVSALALAVLAAACNGDSEGATPTAKPTAIPTAPLNVIPTASATPPPTPEPTATPIPALPPDALAGGASFLWSGSVKNAGVPWTSMRVTVGADPFVDLWEIQLGATEVTRFECVATQDGVIIRLGSCGDGTIAASFSATIDRSSIAAPVGMTATFSEPTPFGPRTVDSFLSPVWERDEPPASENVTLLWQHRADDTSGSYADVWSADGVVFAPHVGGTIELLDAASGERLGQIEASSSVTDVKARDGVLYAATTTAGLLIYDVSDPTAPVPLSQYAITVGQRPDLFTNVHNVYLSPRSSPRAGGGPAPTLVFAINDSHPQTDLRIIDVSDPIAPFEAGRFVIPEARSTLDGAHDVHVRTQGGRQIAFLNSLNSGFFILDVTDPATIELISQTRKPKGAFSHSGWVGELSGRPLYLEGEEGADQHLTLYDVTSLDAPELLAEFATRPGLSVHNIEIDGQYAYVSYYVDGLRVFDLSDPTAPREVAHFDTVPAAGERDILQGAWGVHVAEPPAITAIEGTQTVYISDRESGIYALKVELP